MKINKFNENINYISEFEKYININKKIQLLKDELLGIQKEFFPLVAEYLVLNPQLQEDQDVEIDENEISIEGIRLVDKHAAYYKNFTNEIYEIIYFPYEDAANDDDLESAYMNESDLKDFEIFLEDPDAYKDAKKYNL